MTSADALEAELIAAYTRQEEIYREALGLAEMVLAAGPGGEKGDLLLSRIVTLMEQVSGIERDLAPGKERWRAEGGQPGAALRERLAAIAGLIRKMQSHLDLALHSAQAQKQVLAPELDHLVRRQQGCRAYGEGRASNY